MLTLFTLFSLLRLGLYNLYQILVALKKGWQLFTSLAYYSVKNTNLLYCRKDDDDRFKRAKKG